MKLKALTAMWALVFCAGIAEAGYYRIKLGEAKSLLAALQDFKATETGKSLDLNRISEVMRSNRLTAEEARNLPKGSIVVVSDELLNSKAKAVPATSKAITNESGEVKLKEAGEAETVSDESGPLVPPEVADKISDLESQTESLKSENQELKKAAFASANENRSLRKKLTERPAEPEIKENLRAWWAKARGIILWVMFGILMLLLLLVAALILWRKFFMDRELEVSENGRTCRFAGNLHYMCLECRGKCFMEAELREHLLKCLKAQGKERFEQTEVELDHTPG